MLNSPRIEVRREERVERILTGRRNHTRRKPETVRIHSKDSKASPRLGNRKRDRQGNLEENPGVKVITDSEGEVLKKISETLNAGLANHQRILLLNYCSTERSFSDIMLELRLNPGSLKHHGDLLQANELLDKFGKGKETRYKTTELGKVLLGFVGAVLQAVRES